MKNQEINNGVILLFSDQAGKDYEIEIDFPCNWLPGEGDLFNLSDFIDESDPELQEKYGNDDSDNGFWNAVYGLSFHVHIIVWCKRDGIIKPQLWLHNEFEEQRN
jgi:hypothetical protein